MPYHVPYKCEKISSDADCQALFPNRMRDAHNSRYLTQIDFLMIELKLFQSLHVMRLCSDMDKYML